MIAVMEYRISKQAEAIANRDVTEMAKSPGMVVFWRELLDIKDEIEAEEQDGD